MFKRLHLSRRSSFFPFMYKKRKFTFYDQQEMEKEPSKRIPYAYAFVVDKNAPTFFIAPGGGYCMVCISYEGVFMAEALNRKGFNAFVLNYRVLENAHAPHPQEDMASLIRYVFSHKEKFGLASEKYAVMGFSAGGHLAGSFSVEETGYGKFGLPAPSCTVLCYAVLTMGKDTHKETMMKLTGGDATLRDAYSVEKHLDKYPPTFLWHCLDDKCVPPINSIAVYEGLKERNIPTEIALYQKGGHGLGLGYKTEAENWLDEMVSFAKQFLL